ncbi:MAG: nuclear transport factor 2 family protein [Actinomycetota bacterium]
MEDHPNAAKYRTVSKAFDSGDFESWADMIDDNVEWWEIGSSEPIRGKAALQERMMGLGSNWQVKVDLHDVIANDAHMVALARANATGPKGTLAYKTAEIYHVSNGKITHRWAFSDDTAVITDFFA